jgi:pyruvate dehydrogenase E2 component (dihydrolipoamide acetyltransferase)
MPFRVIMPALELGQETGKLVAWRKKEGESVAKGELLLDVETDKAVVEIEAAGDGILAGIKIQPGEEIAVGRTIAWIVGPGEHAPADGDSAVPALKPVLETAPTASTTSAAPGLSTLAGSRISPKARRLAKEKGVDISRLQGSGPGGEIVVADILAAAESAGAIAAATPETSSSVGRLMAERTTQSWTTVPHFFLMREVDAGTLVAARERLAPAVEKATSVRPTHTDLLVALLAQVLAKHPEMNASWTVAGIRHHAEINIGLAMAVNDGVVACVIQHADKLELGEIARQRKDLAERARAGRLRPSDVAGGTFAISNLGMYGVDAFSAIIIPPQAGILAVGRIADRVVAVDGHPAIRSMMSLTLSCDHRVVDGARAAVFLQHLCEAIGEAELKLRLP